MPRERRSRQHEIEERKEQKKKRVRRLLILSFFLLAAGFYAGVAVYFSSHFYKGTLLYGADCTYLTAQEAKAAVNARLSDYRLQILERNGAAEYLTAAQIGLRYRDDGGIDRMLSAQKVSLWPYDMARQSRSTAQAAFDYDKDLVRDALDGLVCMDASRVTEPRDAYLMATDREYVVVEEVMGTRLDEEKTMQALCAALDAGKTSVSLEGEACYVNPAVYRDDAALQHEAEAKNRLVGAQITYDFGDRTEVVNLPQIEAWMVPDGDGYRLDEEQIREFVTSLAVKYDTFGLTREFQTSLGKTVTLTGGDYGWCIDQEETYAALLDALAGKYVGTMEPVYLYSAMSRDSDDIGGTYVEVCISEQRMWCYEDYILRVDTPVVTGNPSTNHATPSGGVWAIDSKMRQYTLRGEGYAAPVDYWMAFNEDVGIHDLSSRTEFGGKIYLTNGSHGCVNTPYEQAKEIYGIVSVGTPVIVYD